MTGRIHSFQSLGTVDGPGVRCVVFMQGCPLRCACCHNPDTWEFSAGEVTEVEELVRKTERFKSYIAKGGVTVSGGEPLMQAKFVAEFFKKLKLMGIHTALDTSGCVWNSDAEELLNYTDLVLLDYKYSNPEDYLQYTKCEQSNVDRFLQELEKRNISTWLRRVIIPDLNDDEASTVQLRNVAERYKCVEKTELLPFRKLCVEKYKNMGIPFPLADTPEPSEETMEKLNNILNCL